MTSDTLRERARAQFERLGLLDAPLLVVGLSGGLDSCVLLHLLRHGVPGTAELVAAHLDHGMRESSGEDADWVRGLCHAWGMPLVEQTADPAPAGEDEARNARHAFLETVRSRREGALIVTAHHADDQAETVLFRALRGTGLSGLRGIPEARPPGIVRPLLPFWREELGQYARAVGLRWREDPTNDSLDYARNRLRHEVLPRLEQHVAAGARRSLVRLARISSENEEAWAAVLPGILDDLDVQRDAGVVSVGLGPTAALPAALRARVIRGIASELGVSLDEAATRRAVTFTETGRSGGLVELGQGYVLRRELHRLVLTRLDAPLTKRESPEADHVLRVISDAPGEGTAVIGGRRISAHWAAYDPAATSDPTATCDSAAEGDSAAEESDLAPSGTSSGAWPEGPASVCLARDQLRFPLTLRGREPGDRLRTAAGSRKVKKLLLESRIPSTERERVPLLVDSTGRVLWVAGVARMEEDEEGEARWAMTIQVTP